MRIPIITALAGASLALGGCAYNGLGVGLGYGNGYGPYGTYGGYDPYYGSPYGTYASIGYSSGYGNSPYGYGYSPYGYGYSPFGWYDGFYYPGMGSYVYDTYRRPRVWTDAQRRYWTQRVAAVPTTQRVTKQNWTGFDRPTRTRTTTVTSRPSRSTSVLRQQAQEKRTERRAAATTRREERKRTRDE